MMHDEKGALKTAKTTNEKVNAYPVHNQDVFKVLSNFLVTLSFLEIVMTKDDANIILSL